MPTNKEIDKNVLLEIHPSKQLIVKNIVVESENPHISPELGTRYNSIDFQGKIENISAPRPRLSLVPIRRLTMIADFSEFQSAKNQHDTSILHRDSFPENFFDDMLVDHVQERIEQAITEDLEEKYSDRLKLLQELESEVCSEENEKRKRSKRKSRKRSHLPPHSRSRVTDNRSLTPPKHMRNKQVREDLSPPSTSSRYRGSKPSGINEENIFKENSRENLSLLDKQPMKNAHACSDDVEHLAGDQNISEFEQPHLPEIGPHLTPKQKMDQILIRAKTIASYLQNLKANKEKPPLTPFLFTSTVRKLPNSHSYHRQHIYENRSMLHTINNVRYKFNSHSSQFNFEEWGLATMPPLSAKIAKLIGFSADAVHNKLKVSKIPDKIRNIKPESQEEEDDIFFQSKSSLFCNASTQTDHVVKIFPIQARGYDIGVQATPASYAIACQTLETEDPSFKRFDSNDDLPIMSVMQKLNENQLLALHDFAELLAEPACNAMDMYRLRQRMQDIYKCSQLPSALMNRPGPASVNSYTSTHAYSSEHRQCSDMRQQNSTGRIQTVRSADGHLYSNNDSRTNYTGSRSHSNDDYDPRNHSLSQGCSRLDKIRFYGRGGLRR